MTDKKLNDNELNEVSGGGWFSKIWTKAKGVAKDAADNAVENANEDSDSMVFPQG